MRNSVFFWGIVGLFLGVSLLSGCASQQKKKQDDTKQENAMQPYEKMAQEKFGTNAKLAVTPNAEGGDYILCQTEKSREGQIWVSFFLFEKSSGEAVLEDLNMLGSVEWKDAENLQVKYTGNVENPSIKGFTYNLKTKKKTYQVPKVAK